MNLTLVQKVEQTKEIISFIFKSPVDFSFKAGQFLRYHLKEEKRFYSIASSPFEKHISLTTKFNSKENSLFKEALLKLNIGATMQAFGPYGSFSIEDLKQNYVFLAGGIGITPFRSIIMELDHKHLPINITLLYANKTEAILFKKELEEVASRNPNFKIHYLINEHLSEEIIKSHIQELDKQIYYIAGPEPMVIAIEELLEQMGVSDEKIKRDYFTGYTEI